MQVVISGNMKNNAYEQLRKIYNDTFHPDGIPLEFGCEVEVDGDDDYWVTGEYGGCKKHKRECGNNTEKCEYQERVELTHTDMWGEYHKALYFTNEIDSLGKPLTLQMVLRLLGEKFSEDEEYTYSMDIDGGFYSEERGVYEPQRKYLIGIDIDEDPKDWSDEVLSALIEIVK